MPAFRCFSFSIVLVTLAVASSGCAGSLVQPFDRMKNAPITVYRLQNYEPPASQTINPAASLPPQIQHWLSAGAALLPPGLLPPGLLPGAAPPPVAQDASRFHEFRILGWANVSNEKLRGDVINMFGRKSNFDAPRENCMYAEFGFSIGQMNQPPADILVSLSCDQVRAYNFMWPHPNTGLTPDSAKRVVAIVQKAFGGTN